jgi:hypothetical protein
MMNGATESDDIMGTRKRQARRMSTQTEEAGVEYGTMGDTKRALNEALARKHLQLPSWRERNRGESAARFHANEAAAALPPDDEPLVIL